MKISMTSALILGSVLSMSGIALAKTAQSPSTHSIAAAESGKDKQAKKDTKEKAPVKHDAKHPGKDAKPGEVH